MQIDMHTHVLSLSTDTDYMVDYGREVSLCVFRAGGHVPALRMPTEEDWEAAGVRREGWPVLGVEKSRADHPGFDKVVLLAVSPQELDGRIVGTIDTTGITDVPGPPDPEKCNDYVAALVRQDPEMFIGFASVNPVYKGPDAAAAELDRAVTELGLSGVKLYPMYQHWSPADRDLAFPIFAKAVELGIPVMVHQAGSTRIDASLAYARPALLDDAGREFRDLRLIIAHCGIPWWEEAIHLLSKHPNFVTEISYLVASLTPRELFLFFAGCAERFVPLDKIMFGSDYPGFLYDPVVLRDKVLAVNEQADIVGMDPISQEALDGIMGNYAAEYLGIQ